MNEFGEMQYIPADTVDGLQILLASLSAMK
jgi:hypothetical protein